MPSASCLARHLAALAVMASLVLALAPAHAQRVVVPVDGTAHPAGVFTIERDSMLVGTSASNQFTEWMKKHVYQLHEANL